MDKEQIIRIRADSKFGWETLKEIWQYRELLLFLIWKDIKVKYKQTSIGIAWAIIQPFSIMIIFAIFFGKFAKIPSDNIPYPIFAYSALVPWSYFSNSLINATNSIVEYQRVITKVYFPRILLPLSSVLHNLLDFIIAFIILVGMMIFYRIVPSFKIFYAGFFLLLAIITATGVGLWLSALNVKYRDVRYAMNFLVQLWLFATPIAYPSSVVPEQWKALYGLNPMVGVIEGFRWTLLGSIKPDMKMLSVSTGIVMLILLLGMLYFKKTEDTFADIV
ncbi:MAG: ABC transporter permease [bacterium]|nr:ABC transporter permease [bacterium]